MLMAMISASTTSPTQISALVFSRLTQLHDATSHIKVAAQGEREHHPDQSDGPQRRPQKYDPANQQQDAEHRLDRRHARKAVGHHVYIPNSRWD